MFILAKKSENFVNQNRLLVFKRGDFNPVNDC